jgi:hypothetical protein
MQCKLLGDVTADKVALVLRQARDSLPYFSQSIGRTVRVKDSDCGQAVVSLRAHEILASFNRKAEMAMVSYQVSTYLALMRS